MNIKEAKEEIKRTILAYTAKTEGGTYRIPTVRQRPVLLMGPPGIGKTAIMEQAAKECGLGLVAYTMTHHTRQSAIGLPKIETRSFGGREYTVTEYTMSEILASVYEQIEHTGIREGILFLDEINCVSETLMPALLQFLQYKTFGSHKLPEGWIVAAAGNPVRYNQSVRELDTATLDRVKWIEIEPDLGVWQSYAKNESVHPAILSFLNWKPESFYAVQTDQKGRSFVTARGWEDLSRMLLALEELKLSVTEELPGQYLRHEEIAREFWIYYQLYQSCKEMPYEELAGRPYDERLCMLQLMLQKVYGLADAWRNAGALAESLRYFLEGCKRQAQANISEIKEKDVSRTGACKLGTEADICMQDWLMLCQGQLEKRQQGIQVKKECGLLTPAEEEREALLAKAIMRQLGIWRLEANRPNRKETSPIQEKGTCAFTVVQEQEEKQEQLEKQLCSMLQEDASFMGRTFMGRQEQYLFTLGILEHKNTESFLKQKLPELYQELKQTEDLNQEEAALRGRISPQAGNS